MKPVTDSPMLTQPSEEIVYTSKGTEKIVHSMWRVLKESHGVGLAAVQIGIPIQLIIATWPTRKDEPLRPTNIELVNPRIVGASVEMETDIEGCLSCPDVKLPKERHSSIIVEGFTLRMKPTRIFAHGMMARILQHEIDHTKGVLIA